MIGICAHAALSRVGTPPASCAPLAERAPAVGSTGGLAAMLAAQPETAAQVHGRIDLATVLELLYG